MTNHIFTCLRFTLMPRMAQISECASASWSEIFMTGVSGIIVRPALGQRLSQAQIEQVRQDIEGRQSRQTVDDMFVPLWAK